MKAAFISSREITSEMARMQNGSPYSVKRGGDQISGLTLARLTSSITFEVFFTEISLNKTVGCGCKSWTWNQIFKERSCCCWHGKKICHWRKTCLGIFKETS